MKVINLLSGPGAGKSTTAAGLFYQMKLKGINVELITEYAKDMTWEERYNTLSNQLYIFAKQYSRQLRVKNKVDYIVTDSPLLLSLIYTPKNYPGSFELMVMDFWNEFDNYNFFIRREKKYNPIGRNQTEDEAKDIDIKIWNMLNLRYIDYVEIPGNQNAINLIMEQMDL